MRPPRKPGAETKAGATIDTPYGKAPMSFADLVDKVKPSVVSVSIVNDGGASKVADKGGKSKGGQGGQGGQGGPGGGQGGPGFSVPDLPEDVALQPAVGCGLKRGKRLLECPARLVECPTLQECAAQASESMDFNPSIAHFAGQSQAGPR